MEYQWILGAPAQTDNTNFEWILGEPYVLYEVEVDAFVNLFRRRRK